MKKIVVVGGGPAGMMAACTAARRGAEVILVEKMDKLGLKLSITGKGKCNITNSESDISEFIKKYGSNNRFLINALHAFSNKDLIDFLQKEGLKLKELSGGRIYPNSDNAWSVVDVFKKCLKDSDVQVILEAPVKELLHYQNEIGGVVHAKGTILSDAVIVATGGKSYSRTGSSGDGYDLARKAGHKVTDLYPVLVPFNLEGIDETLIDLKLKNIKAWVTDDSRELAEAFGEFYFTFWGADGSVILRLSRYIKQEIQEDYLTLHVDLKPALEPEKLIERLLCEIKDNGKSTYSEMLKNLLPAQMIPFIISRTKIPADLKLGAMKKEQRDTIAHILKDLTFTITSTRPFDEAILTSGGVDLSKIDPRTMESKIIEGLYFAGEILDIDGDTGGYNLQAAFSTGFVAGDNAAKELINEED
ncbi:MAG TPA: NAD(P)/FAD-dependent oxidoreductase [Candidatus Cloacimonetes bacterium]|nr:NAD(P)/FAD-dependent oxidoreductase [Candidatus Cloacimonadota bacterium]HEX38248.1 NAD(P)/FAD-dependent oxidoreductase [Candidatus Cloacimonadota bacterium]